MLKKEKNNAIMEKEWKDIARIKIPNAPEYLDEVINLIIKNNPNLHNVSFDADFTDENNKRILLAYNKLVAGIREFEEALLYL